MTVNRDELLPCPHCEPWTQIEAYFDDLANRWRVGCGACGSSSGTTKKREDAIALWNRRAARSLTDGGQINAAPQDGSPMGIASCETPSARSAGAAPSSPEQSGFKWVPVEPTEEWRVAYSGGEWTIRRGDVWTDSVYGCQWRVMALENGQRIYSPSGLGGTFVFRCRHVGGKLPESWKEYMLPDNTMAMCGDSIAAALAAAKEKE